MTLKALLINVHSSKNVGDAALLQVTIKQLKNNFPDINIDLCMDDPESHAGPEKAYNSFSSWVHPFSIEKRLKWNLLNLLALLPITLIPLITYRLFKKRIFLFATPRIKETINTYLDVNIVVSVPGGFLYSSGHGLSLLIAIYSIFYACWSGKPVYIFPQSFGPFNHIWENALIKKLLDRVRIVMVREPISLHMIDNLHLHNGRIYLIPDLAFSISSEGEESGGIWLREKGIIKSDISPIMGMTTINWGAQNKSFTHQSDYERACVNVIYYFIKNLNGQVVLFPHVYGPLASQDDRIPAHRIADRLPELSRFISVIDEPIQVKLLKSIYGCMDIFIGTRTHSNIFALCAGVPVIAIGYLHKTEGIAQMVGIEQWVIDIRKTNNNELTEKLSALWQDRQEWHHHIMERIPGLIIKANSAGQIIAEDYYHQWLATHEK